MGTEAAPAEHALCRELLRTKAAATGTEVDVSTVPSFHPLAENFTCPHGVTYSILPTAEQIARWDAGTAGVVYPPGESHRTEGETT